VHFERQSGTGERPEPLVPRQNSVAAGRQQRYGVIPKVVGHRVPFDAGGLIDHGYLGVLDNGAGRIRDLSGQLRRISLREHGGTGKSKQRDDGSKRIAFHGSTSSLPPTRWGDYTPSPVKRSARAA